MSVYIVVGGSLIIDLLGSLVTSLSVLTRLSLFHYVARAPAEDPSWAALTSYTVVAAVVTTAAVLIFDHRDLVAE